MLIVLPVSFMRNSIGGTNLHRPRASTQRKLRQPAAPVSAEREPPARHGSKATSYAALAGNMICHAPGLS